MPEALLCPLWLIVLILLACKLSSDYLHEASFEPRLYIQVQLLSF